jgi:hypothetical protein
MQQPKGQEWTRNCCDPIREPEQGKAEWKLSPEERLANVSKWLVSY